jgi:cytochrome c
MRRTAFCILIFLGNWQLTAQAAGDAARGQQLYQAKCSACHSIDYNGVGPAHKNLFGRKAGSLPDYTYSPALQASAIVWDEKNLDKWLTNPEKLVPGQKMGFMVPAAKERADLIAYLKQATQKN